MSKRPNATFAYVLSSFLSIYLPDTKGASENTILSYRDTFSLFLIFCREQHGIAPEKLTFKKMSRQLVEDFLKWTENERGCSISTRNQRLAAMRSLFRYVEIYYPEHLLLCEQIISIPSKTTKHGRNAHLRQKGKIAELALGYGGSVGALKSMGALEKCIRKEDTNSA